MKKTIEQMIEEKEKENSEDEHIPAVIILTLGMVISGIAMLATVIAGCAAVGAVGALRILGWM